MHNIWSTNHLTRSISNYSKVTSFSLPSNVVRAPNCGSPWKSSHAIHWSSSAQISLKCSTLSLNRICKPSSYAVTSLWLEHESLILQVSEYILSRLVLSPETVRPSIVWTVLRIALHLLLKVRGMVDGSCEKGSRNGHCEGKSKVNMKWIWEWVWMNVGGVLWIVLGDLSVVVDGDGKKVGNCTLIGFVNLIVYYVCCVILTWDNVLVIYSFYFLLFMETIQVVCIYWNWGSY
jgi:hypothetical protein